MYKDRTSKNYKSIRQQALNCRRKRPKFITKKKVEVHDQLGNKGGRYKPNKHIMFKTSMVQSDLCNYSDAYIAVKGTIRVEVADKREKKWGLCFKK